MRVGKEEMVKGTHVAVLRAWPKERRGARRICAARMARLKVRRWGRSRGEKGKRGGGTEHVDDASGVGEDSGE